MMDANSQPEVGVGPWPGGPESWPSDDVYDPQLLADGDRRNVEDRYRYWKMEAIIADIAAHALPFEIAIENLGHDFNIGSIVRSANALGVSRVHIVGRRRWNGVARWSRIDTLTLSTTVMSRNSLIRCANGDCRWLASIMCRAQFRWKVISSPLRHA